MCVTGSFNKPQRFHAIRITTDKLNNPESKVKLERTKDLKKYVVKTGVKKIPNRDTPNISWYQVLMSGAKRYFLNSIRPSSKKTYSTGQRRWFTVAEIIGTDPLMRIIPKDWEIRSDQFSMSTLTWKESCMLAFLASCRDLANPVIPSTAFAYLSAVRKFMEENGVDTDFFENSQYIRNTKAGMINVFRAEMNGDERDPERLAITIDMILGYDKYTRDLLGAKYGLVQMAVYTAQVLGYTTLSRISEYLLVPGEAEHLLLSENIMFETKSGDLIPSNEIDHTQWSEIQGCIVDILSAKNDKKHKGNRLYFGLSDINDPNQAYCITSTLWNYAKKARPVKGRSFFYIHRDL